MTRQEHMNWCKERAREYLDQGDIPNAITSMLSDLTKHPDTKASGEGILAMMGMSVAMSGDPREARRFIDGFN